MTQKIIEKLKLKWKNVGIKKLTKQKQKIILVFFYFPPF